MTILFSDRHWIGIPNQNSNEFNDLRPCAIVIFERRWGAGAPGATACLATKNLRTT
jgi:hypothetical protein